MVMVFNFTQSMSHIKLQGATQIKRKECNKQHNCDLILEIFIQQQLLAIIVKAPGGFEYGLVFTGFNELFILLGGKGIASRDFQMPLSI